MSVWLQPASADEWWAVERPHRDRKRPWGLNVTAILTSLIRLSFIATKRNYIVFAKLHFAKFRAMLYKEETYHVCDSFENLCNK